ncbi:MAG: NAD-dependent epimerase/dehydratase family protein [Actinomycetes bacterium]
MQVLVTGGAGFIGANLCRRLISEGPAASVVVLDDLSTGSADNLAGIDVDLVEGTILDEALVARLCADADAVVHLAALGSVPRSVAQPVATHAANATGTLTVLEGARHGGVRQVVVASSSSVYGANPTLPKHEGLAQLPLSPYAASKLATEAYALAYQHSYGLPVLAFRFFNVFGPYQAVGQAYAAVVPVFVAAALAGRPVPVHGDGTQSRDFTSVDTVTSVVAEALARGVVHPEPVNLAYGTRTDLLTLLGLLEDILGHSLERDHGPRRAGDVDHSRADDTRVRGLFPDVHPVPLPEALRSTVEWYRRSLTGGDRA